MLIPYKSSSHGNFYEVHDGASRLMLECGLPKTRLRALCKRPLTDYAGCLITHEHNDHAACAKEIERLGIPLFTSAGTAQAIGLKDLPNVHRLTDGSAVMVGSYQVRPFTVAHDAVQPLGFLIQSMHSGDKLVFATDTCYMRYTFSKVQEIAVECNYSLASLNASGMHPEVRRRIERSHFEVGRVIEWLKACDLRCTRRIWLLHLSAQHGNAEEFRECVQAATGIETIIAEG